MTRDVYIGPAHGGDRLLVIGRDLAEAASRTYQTLCTARTFADLQADVAAAALVADYLGSYLERLAEDLYDEENGSPDPSDPAFVAEHTGPDAPFAIDDFFVGDDDLVPVPEARHDSDAWLRRHLADTYERLAEPDSGWGFMELAPVPSIPIQHRAQIEAELDNADWTPIWRDDLHDVYEAGGL